MALKITLVFKKLLEFKFDTLQEYIQENQLENILRKQRVEDEFSEAIKDIADEDYEQVIIGQYIDDNTKYLKDFPSLFNDSTFLTIYSFFEVSMARACEICRSDLNRFNKRQITKILSKSYIDDSKQYLSKDCRIPLSVQNETWKKIDILRKYRNFIAHNNSDLDHTKNDYHKQKKKELIKQINQIFGKCIIIDDSERCYIENQKLLIDFLQLTKDYLFYVLDKVASECNIK